MKIKTILLIGLIALAFSITACEKEGEGEKAGKKIDNALSSMKDKIHDATK